MKLLFVVLVVAVIAAVFLALLKGKKSGAVEAPKPKRPLTNREQPMYWRLTEALPEHVVLAQVAFSAFLSGKTQSARNRWNRKRADFVICDKSFRVVAVIELDDSTHSAEKDGDRDEIIRSAGIPVLRYKRVPDIKDVQKDVQSLSRE